MRRKRRTRTRAREFGISVLLTGRAMCAAFFFRRREDTAPDSQLAREILQEKAEQLEKRIEYCDKKMDQQTTMATKHLRAQNKTAAMACMKRKRQIQSQQQHFQTLLDRLQEQITTLEASELQADTFRAMRLGADSMRGLNKQVDADKIDDSIDDIRETFEQAHEVTQALSTSLGGIGAGYGDDEDELAAELEELMQSDLNKQLPSAAAAAPAPARATATAEEQHKVRGARDDKEHKDDGDGDDASLRDELRKLAAHMS